MNCPAGGADCGQDSGIGGAVAGGSSSSSSDAKPAIIDLLEQHLKNKRPSFTALLRHHNPVSIHEITMTASLQAALGTDAESARLSKRVRTTAPTAHHTDMAMARTISRAAPHAFILQPASCNSTNGCIVKHFELLRITSKQI
jgi:hypothetical protein